MRDLVFQGQMLFPDGWSDATVVIEEGRITHFSDSLETCSDRKKLIRGLIFPGLLDMHTHLGDHGARGDLPTGLEETVFPGGLKHRYLQSASKDDLLLSIRRSLEELHHGATFTMDFREGGIEGIETMKDAITPEGPKVFSMGRPVPGQDPADIIEMADGIGMPSLTSDWDGIRALARDHQKPFSIHASELFREDISEILDVGPDQLVHMVSGTEDDWSAVESDGIPVVLCPRSNLTFNIDVPLGEMFNQGLRLSLGTDNSLSCMHDIFREMELAWMLLRRGDLTGSEASQEVFSMAVGKNMEGTALLDMLPSNRWWWEKGWPKVGDTPNMFIVDEPLDDLWKRDPYSFVVRFMDRSRLSYTGHL